MRQITYFKKEISIFSAGLEFCMNSDRPCLIIIFKIFYLKIIKNNLYSLVHCTLPANSRYSIRVHCMNKQIQHWYWLLNKLAFSNSLFLVREEAKPVNNTPKAMGAKSRLELRVLALSLPSPCSPHVPAPSCPGGASTTTWGRCEKLSSEFRGEAPESWENCGNIIIISECSDEAAQSHSGRSWGEKWSPLLFSHTTLPNQCCSSMRGLPWKGLDLNASSSEVLTSYVDGWWAIMADRWAFEEVLIVFVPPALSAPGSAVCNRLCEYFALRILE